MTPIGIRIAAIALSIASGSVGGAGSTAEFSERSERVRHDLFQADGGREGMDDCQSQRQRRSIFLLRRCRTEFDARISL